LGERFGSIDFRVFKREMDAAGALVHSDSATQAQVDAQKDRLILAGEQLVPAERRLLENAIAAANEVSDDNFTDESWKNFTDAREDAQAELDNDAATDSELLAAREALGASIAALETNPATAPRVPDALAVTVNGSSITVTWSAPDDDGGAALEGYVVVLDDGHQVRIEDPSQTSAVFTWLKPGTDYKARVMAINEAGTSEASEYSAAVAPTTAGATDTPPGASTPDETNATLEGIQVAGVAIDGFATGVATYVVDWPDSLDLPDVTATSTIDDAVVEITAGAPVMNLVSGGGGDGTSAGGGDNGATDNESAAGDTGSGQDGSLSSTGAQCVAILALISVMLLGLGLGLAQYRRRNSASTEVSGQTPLS
jgi:uncharacterized membrane protein